MQTVYIISGPTSSGKTEYAVKLARRLGSTSRRKVGIKSEIISADSRQVYKGMTIGSGAPVLKNGCYRGVRHHLIGVIEPNTAYTAFDFQKDAYRLIEQIQKRNKVPIIVGGTGLWIRALKEELDFQLTKPNAILREQLEKDLKKKGLEYLVKKLKKIEEKELSSRAEASEAWRSRSDARNEIASDDGSGQPSSLAMTRPFDYHNPRRVIRALEIALSQIRLGTSSINSGSNYSLNGAVAESKGYHNEITNFKTIHLSPSKETLNKRINKRVDEMVKKGLVKEVKRLLKKYNLIRKMPSTSSGIKNFLSPERKHLKSKGFLINESKLKRYPALTGIGYREIIDYLQGKITLSEAIELIKLHTSQYAKHQLTWFKKYH